MKMSKKNKKIIDAAKKSGLDSDLVQFLYESNAIEEERSTVALADAIDAWKYLRAARMPLMVKNVLECHRILMCRLRPDIAGRIRNCAVWIGGELKPAYPEIKLKEDLDEVLLQTEFAIDGSLHHGMTDEEKEKLAKESHLAFENAHVFEDGNGRVGRILYQWTRLELGLPLKIIWSKTKWEEYYPWFKK
jgi:Fic family protein